MLNELNFINLLSDPFLDVEDNDLFCKEVFSLLDTKENKVQVQGNDYQENIQKSIRLLKETIVNLDVTAQEGRLLLFRENEIEAVLMNMKEVFNELDKILELTKFSIGYGDFILVAEDFEFGLCIERTEYFYEFTKWGLQ